ncbi:MAG: helix-turn-helix transcriptional regulator [Lachnospiraceae bacterium]|nr:helix-turn-helix transcriptional regulator [Lachnospiraceae bacterium]
MARLTDFGRFCKKLRIDNDELLADMSAKLGVTAAFLSQVENGKKKPPKEWETKIQELYRINESQVSELKDSIYRAINSECIDITSYNMGEKEIMLSFARKIKTLDIDEFDVKDVDIKKIEKRVFKKLLEEI